MLFMPLLCVWKLNTIFDPDQKKIELVVCLGVYCQQPFVLVFSTVVAFVIFAIARLRAFLDVNDLARRKRRQAPSNNPLDNCWIALNKST